MDFLGIYFIGVFAVTFLVLLSLPVLSETQAGHLGDIFFVTSKSI